MTGAGGLPDRDVQGPFMNRPFINGSAGTNRTVRAHPFHPPGFPGAFGNSRLASKSLEKSGVSGYGL